MQRIAILICFSLMLGMLASAQDVRTNYMPGTDFSKYHTYAWVDEVKGVPRVGGQPDQILDAQVKQAVDSQMAAKGLTKVVDGDRADLLLGYQLAIDREKQINGFANGGGRGAGAAGALGPEVSIHFQRLLQASTSGLSSLVCMTLLQRSSFGSVLPNMRLNPAKNKRKIRKGSTKERKNC